MRPSFDLLMLSVLQHVCVEERDGHVVMLRREMEMWLYRVEKLTWRYNRSEIWLD